MDSFDRRSLLAVLTGSSAALFTAAAHANDIVATSQSTFDAGSATDGNIQLQTIGALGVGHIQSTLGLIGVIADSVTKEIYNQRQIEDLMKGTINGLDIPKKMLRKLQDSRVSGDDAEFIDRMISVFNALQKEAQALIVYSKSRKPDDATKYEKERRLVLRKLGELTQHDELIPLNPVPRTVPNSSTGNSTDASN